MDMDRTAHSCAGQPSEETARRWNSAEDEEAGSDVNDDQAGYQPLWVRLACILLDFLTQTYDQIRIVPEIVLFERWICAPYLPPGSEYSHSMCKSHEVQYELAHLRSWKAFFDGVASMTFRAMHVFLAFVSGVLKRRAEPVLITAVPMGLLADRIGRKGVIATSIMGPLLSLCWIMFICTLLHLNIPLVCT